MALTLDPADRDELEARSRSRTLRADDVRRARLILLLADGESYTAIVDKLGCNRSYVSTWKKRFEEDGLAGLYARHQGRTRSVLTPSMEARILSWTARKPTDGSTHWTSRKLGKKLGVSHTLIATAWKRANLKPHRMARYMASNDPDFERKAADVIGLYVNPPQHAAVFCVDEKTAFKLSIDSIPFSRSRRDDLSGTGSSTTGTGRSRCTPRSTPSRGKSSAKPQRATPAKSSSRFFPRSSPRNERARKST